MPPVTVCGIDGHQKGERLEFVPDRSKKKADAYDNMAHDMVTLRAQICQGLDARLNHSPQHDPQLFRRADFFEPPGRFFLRISEPKSAATFRPHLNSTLLLNGAKWWPFSGRTFWDHDFDFVGSRRGQEGPKSHVHRSPETDALEDNLKPRVVDVHAVRGIVCGFQD